MLGLEQRGWGPWPKRCDSPAGQPAYGEPAAPSSLAEESIQRVPPHVRPRCRNPALHTGTSSAPTKLLLTLFPGVVAIVGVDLGGGGLEQPGPGGDSGWTAGEPGAVAEHEVVAVIDQLASTVPN